ncbi:MAG: hypothetical protein HYX69_19040 [Planctomycetia bacterium]|nr:hypothetical protein [Planctomycetia bacterium]
MTRSSAHQPSLQSAALEASISADSGRRMRHLAIGFMALAGLVFARIVAIECSQGAAFRAVAARPLEKSHVVPGIRGRILSSDGTVLAFDERVSSLAVHYRYLQGPASARWLRNQARARVPRDTSNRRASLAAEEQWLRAYCDELLVDLGRLCGRPVADLREQSERIQSRVHAISVAVNRARSSRSAGDDNERPPATALRRARAVLPSWLFAAEGDRPSPSIVVAEELDYHVLVDEVPLEVVAEIESRPERYPGVRIVEQSRRRYPEGTLAANVLGHLGASEQHDAAGRKADAAARAKGTNRPVRQATRPVGRLGAELEHEAALRGIDGQSVDLTDHGGRMLRTVQVAEPAMGQDVVLSLDARLQRVAEGLLDRAVARHAAQDGGQDGPGRSGAIVVMDVRNGAILAAASAPRFNPNTFAVANADSIELVLADRSHPLFDRVTKMAIPPGSVFKIVTALALLADADFAPRETLDCQGYLREPDRQRCQIFRRYGVGHGATDLADAIVQSCNVYFFHHAGRLGPERLVDWGLRLGFGRTTGIDLPNEAIGFLPNPANPGGPADHKWGVADTQALAIGQSTLVATPLQVARLLAVVANGGYLVTPHVTADGHVASDAPVGGTSTGALPGAARGTPVEGLTRRQLDALRDALRRVVADDRGTAHAALAGCGVAIAGKTGTAETGGQTSDHAWFAAYAPADAPRVALVVALAHGGSADRATMIAADLVPAIQALGLLRSSVPPRLAEANERQQPAH